MKNISITANSAVKSVLFGLMFSCIISLSVFNKTNTISPFESTFIGLTSASLLSFLAFSKELWNCGKLSAGFFKRTSLTGLCIALGLFFIVFGLTREKSILTACLILSSSPILSLIFRKLFWDEAFFAKQKFGILISLFALSVWMLLPMHLKFQDPILPKIISNASNLSGSTLLIFMGTLFWSASFAITRPSECSVTTGVYWTWSLFFSAMIGIPLMAAGQRMTGSLSGLHNLSAAPSGIYLAIAFGATALFSRILLLAKTSSFVTSDTLSFLWVFTTVFVAILFSGHTKAPMDAVHFASLIAFVIGVYLARSSSRDWNPYFGLREVV